MPTPALSKGAVINYLRWVGWNFPYMDHVTSLLTVFGKCTERPCKKEIREPIKPCLKIPMTATLNMALNMVPPGPFPKSK